MVCACGISSPWFDFTVFISFRQGIDLNTGELRPHNPDDTITKIARVEYWQVLAIQG
jgi:hypothetical protein